MQFNFQLPPTLGPAGTFSPPIFLFDDFLNPATVSTTDVPTDIAATDEAIWLLSETDVATTGDSGFIQTEGGEIELRPAATAADAQQIQGTMTGFTLDLDQPLIFATRLKYTTATGDSYIGLATKDTTITVASEPTDFIGFTLTADADLEILARDGGSGSKTDSGQDITAATYHQLTFIWDGVGTVRFSIDGTNAGVIRTGLPTATVLAPVLTMESNGAAEVLTVDWVFCQQNRP